jgi:hypothetical protein
MMTSSVDTIMISSSGCDSIAPIAANTGGLLPSVACTMVPLVDQMVI